MPDPTENPTPAVTPVPDEGASKTATPPTADQQATQFSSLDDALARYTAAPSEAPKDEVVTPPAAGTPPEKKDEPATPAADAPPEKTDDVPPEKKDEPAAPAAFSLDDIKLSEHARPSTSAAFATLKERSIAKVTELTGQVATLTAQLEEAKATASKNPEIPPEVATELETLRAFREAATLDGDPKFDAKYNAPVAAVETEILDKIKSAGMTDEDLAKIKEIGIGNLDWDGFLKDTPRIRMFVQQRLLRREDLLASRAAAVKSAQESVASAVEERRRAAATQETASVEQATKGFEENLTQLPSFQLAAPAATAPQADKDAHAARRSVLEQATAEGRRILGLLNTPKGAAEAAAIVSLGWVFRSERNAALKQLETTRAASVKETEALKGEVAKLKSELDAAQKEVAHIRTSGGFGSGGKLPPRAGSTPGNPFESLDDALARHRAA